MGYREEIDKGRGKFVEDQIETLVNSVAFKWFVEELDRRADQLLQRYVLNEFEEHSTEKKYTEVHLEVEKYRALKHVDNIIRQMGNRAKWVVEVDL